MAAAATFFIILPSHFGDGGARNGFEMPWLIRLVKVAPLVWAEMRKTWLVFILEVSLLSEGKGRSKSRGNRGKKRFGQVDEMFVASEACLSNVEMEKRKWKWKRS